jgi:DNA processing protein
MECQRPRYRVLGMVSTVCYPKENKKLYEKVLERGASISEFPLRTHSAPEDFSVRNRIVAWYRPSNPKPSSGIDWQLPH